MRRSEINGAIRYAMKTLHDNSLMLPAFAYWECDEWKRRRDELDNIRAIGLGWDVTDFGSSDFEQIGAVLFTVRNGSITDPGAGTPYSEKIIILRHEAGQMIPFHFHKMKTEDIINRGGGVLMLELYESTPAGCLDKNSEIRVKMDGILHILPPGSTIEVKKGCSITLHPGLHHRFWAKKGAGDLVVGEVSSINDDNTDNVFLEEMQRFSEIEEDEPVFMPLCSEYDGLIGMKAIY